MKSRYSNRFVLLFVIIVSISCSTRKNTMTTRAYHNLSAHYNVYFNAKQSVKAGEQRIEKGINDDYSQILPVFKSSRAEAAKLATSEMEVAISKCNKLIALHSITKSPKRKANSSLAYKKFASKGEYNKWVDDSYALIGIANFYNHDYRRAIENFNFVIRRYPGEPSRYTAYLWMARAQIETSEYDKAGEILNALSRDSNFPNNLRGLLFLTQTQLYLALNQSKMAITYLQSALKCSMPRSEKIRAQYLLAQLYSQTDQPALAENLFLKIVHRRPSYEMGFNARIARIQAMSNKDEAIRQLDDLLNDQLNSEYQDQIFYTRGLIELKDKRRDQALSYFTKSTTLGQNNPRQKALSALAAARIYFERNELEMASAYYDTTMLVIDPYFPGYNEISARASGLKKLSKELATLQREDSLQRVAQMPQNERNAFINRLIESFKVRDEERAKQQMQSNELQAYRPTASRLSADNAPGGQQQNGWYFYNPPVVGIGKTEFQRIWGRRKLEDNWRRANKQQLSVEEMPVDSGDNPTAARDRSERKKGKLLVTDPHSLNYYLQDLPLTDSLKRESDSRIKSALYASGHLFYSEFNLTDRAIEQFEQLINRYPGNEFELTTLFELVRLNQTPGSNSDKSDHWKSLLIEKYPGSNYARFLINPNYFKEMEASNDLARQIYAKSVEAFKASNYPLAWQKADSTLMLSKDSTLITKAKLISILSRGTTQSRQVFSTELSNYLKSFPFGETSVMAMQVKELLDTDALTDTTALLAKGYIAKEFVNNIPGQGFSLTQDEFRGQFSYDENLFHYFILAFPKEAKVDVNQLIFDISRYNLDYYPNSDFDIESISLDNSTQIIVVRSLASKEEGMIYFRSIIRKREVYAALKGIEYTNFVASSTNFRTILAQKSYAEYLKFFIKNYSAYVGSNFPTDKLPNPMDLIAKVKKEREDVPTGKFVVVNTNLHQPKEDQKPKSSTTYKGPYSTDKSAYTFAIIWLKNQADPNMMTLSFKEFIATNFAGPAITIETTPLDENRMILVIKNLGEQESATVFENKSRTDNKLLQQLKGIGYRSFLITEKNLQVFKKDKNLASYLDFLKQSQ